MRIFTLSIRIAAKKKTWNNLKSSWATMKNIKEDISMISHILMQLKVGKRITRFKLQVFSLCKILEVGVGTIEDCIGPEGIVCDYTGP